MVAFCFIYENVDREEESFNKILLMSIGEVVEQNEAGKWLVFCIGMLVNLIILLNLLISIVQSTFNDVNSE